MQKVTPLNVVLEKFRKKHGTKFDYSLISENNYIDTQHKVPIKCNKCGEIFPQTPNNHMKGAGCPFCRYEYVSKKTKNVPRFNNRSLVFGFGIFDMDISCISNDGSIILPYRLWHGMIRRCYDNKYKNHKTSYYDCSVCEEWKHFSNFNKWFDKHKAEYKEGYQLDKDILIKGNKVYSPETCCFVPNEINSLIKRYPQKDTPTGITKSNDKYMARVSKYHKSVFLGSFDTIEEAFKVYKNERELYIREIAQKYFNDGKIARNVYEALMNYKVEITD
jgi:hypothetical protein